MFRILGFNGGACLVDAGFDLVDLGVSGERWGHPTSIGGGPIGESSTYSIINDSLNRY